MMDTKKCRGCAQAKPMSEFYRHPQMADGHLHHCKDCKKSYAVRRHRRLMEEDPVWREKERARGRAKALGKTQKQTARKQVARNAVSNAVRDRRLTKAGRCDDCGHDFRHFRREAHHEDYDKPLQVAWLCSLCHGKRHRRRT